MCHDQQMNSTLVDRLHWFVMPSSRNRRCVPGFLVVGACCLVASAGLGWALSAVEEGLDGEEESVVEEADAYDPGLEPLVMMAANDLAKRLEVAVETIEVLEAKLVVWPDAAMGCPDPEMVYIQVPQDGSVIRLQCGDQVYQYHTGGARMPFLCEEPTPSLGPNEEEDFESD